MVGLVVEHRLRRRGEVRIEQRSWLWDRRIPSHQRMFEVRFFNDRDVNISLWDARVEFYRGAELLDSLPAFKAFATLIDDAGRPVEGEEVGPIDLESRTSVYRQMEVHAESDEMLERLKSADRVEFVATTIPGGGQVRKALTSWDDLEGS
jgi:hypothetical protein